MTTGGVEFDEDKFSYTSAQRRPVSGGMSPGMVYRQPTSGSGISGWLIRKGIVKSSESAQVVLIAVVIVNAIITFIVIRYLL